MSEWINQENQVDAVQTVSTNEDVPASKNTMSKKFLTKKRLVICVICVARLITAVVIV